jgi:hypothetical protein
MPTARLEDLELLHTPETLGRRPDLERLSDSELLASVLRPANGDPIRINTKTHALVDGNARIYELKRRMANPNSGITPDTEIPYSSYTPDDSFFPDLP